MTIILNEDQTLIQTMVRKFAREIVAKEAAERDQSGTFPKEIFQQMGELGLMGMLVPETYGGSGADAVSYAIALSEIAYACASTAVVMSVHNSICCESILNFGSQAQQQLWLPKMCTGTCIGAFGLTEPEAGSNPASQKTTAVRDGKYWVLNGTKQFITSGKNGGVVIVIARTDKAKAHGGISAFLVPQGTPGMTIGASENKMGLRASDTVQLIFEDCRVPEDAMLGKPGQGFKLAMTALDSGRIGVAAQSIGVAEACLDEAVAYAKTREQFGRPIGDFQGIRWYIAEMATEIEAARLMCHNAAVLKSSGQPYTMAASMAKMYASEMVNRVAGRALQIHGGYGYCKEYPVERHYRDARVFTIYEGTTEIQRLVISNGILGPIATKS
ncbi:MAG: acyl-CoA dehydrogenase [Myxococcota bacterium]|nr:acyl-CoA dehydrogenase [Myxococcota bacterium]